MKFPAESFYSSKICFSPGTAYLHQGEVGCEAGVARKAGFFKSVEQLFVDQSQVVFSLFNLGVGDLVAERVDSLELNLELSWDRFDNVVPQSLLNQPFRLFKLVLLNVGHEDRDVCFLHWDIVAMPFQVWIPRDASRLESFDFLMDSGVVQLKMDDISADVSNISVYLKGDEDIWILFEAAFLLSLPMLGFPLRGPLCPRFRPVRLDGDLGTAGDQRLLLLHLRRRHPLALLNHLLEDVFSFRVIVSVRGLLLMHGEELGASDCLFSKFFLSEILIGCLWYPTS